ncbi:hypothetical protein IHQ71_31375 (plasmid) [Rhizobium sp. TH2]|uniref:hypothetical protein n=1 Tax=Rhizobium sp. TH2 TaxID=2775403 RepID=UPI0021585781|nr:hypothetical protein [Rhizobium sp. TH2]UVC12667.1 hypothetical protein IHQ71_31375 [Rhizobium sp. TH2]
MNKQNATPSYDIISFDDGISVWDYQPDRLLFERMLLAEIESKKSMAIRCQGEDADRIIYPYIAAYDDADELYILYTEHPGPAEDGSSPETKTVFLKDVVDAKFLDAEFSPCAVLDPRHPKYYEKIIRSCDPSWIKLSRQGDMEDDDFEEWHESFYGVDVDRRRSDLLKAEDYYRNIAWYTRSFLRTKADYQDGLVNEELWQKIRAYAAQLEARIGVANLIVLDDHEWGIVYGKLSALRWALNDYWDNLDT